MSPDPTPAQHDVVQAILAEHAGLPGALLPILHAVQHALGHVPQAAVPQIAAALNLSRAEVHGVVTYYHHFRTEPAGRHVLQVCRAEACQARGAEALLSHARQHLGCSEAQPTSADGQWTVEPVYCLGLCASSPAVQLGERLHARMTASRLDAVIAAATAAQDATNEVSA
jgi:formate dehydrogenase subunit gamma